MIGSTGATTTAWSHSLWASEPAPSVWMADRIQLTMISVWSLRQRRAPMRRRR